MLLLEKHKNNISKFFFWILLFDVSIAGSNSIAFASDGLNCVLEAKNDSIEKYKLKIKLWKITRGKNLFTILSIFSLIWNDHQFFSLSIQLL